MTHTSEPGRSPRIHAIVGRVRALLIAEPNATIPVRCPNRANMVQKPSTFPLDYCGAQSWGTKPTAHDALP